MDAKNVYTPRGSFVGLTTVDVIFDLSTYPAEYTKTTARQYTMAAGGPASNAAVAFSYLGGRARLLSRLGRSSIAAIARDDLARYGVQHVAPDELSAREPALSAIAVSERTGSRTIFTSPAMDDESSVLLCDAKAAAFWTATDILLLDGHESKVAAHIARQAQEQGITIVLDGDLYG